jgi:hypothetical protein
MFNCVYMLMNTKYVKRINNTAYDYLAYVCLYY